MNKEKQTNRPKPPNKPQIYLEFKWCKKSSFSQNGLTRKRTDISLTFHTILTSWRYLDRRQSSTGAHTHPWGYSNINFPTNQHLFYLSAEATTNSPLSHVGDTDVLSLLRYCRHHILNGFVETHCCMGRIKLVTAVWAWSLWYPQI